MAGVRFCGVSKVYDGGARAVTDLDISIADGELVVLVGPSGCGKTTALRLIAGLEEISEGEILIGDGVVNDLEPQDRDIAMVFQNYALYPHMTVYQNISFPLRFSGIGRAQRDEKVRSVARVLGLESYLDRRPRQLSGGQRQRVAMGRAIVREPQVFLMDEPLSNLDAKLRVQMRAEIANLQRTLKITTVYVTHDQVEAMTIGDRVAVMRRGRLQQIETPQTLYQRPANLFVAGFIGSPPMNFVEGTLEGGNKAFSVRIGEQSVLVDHFELARFPDLQRHVGQRLVVGVRPEGLTPTDDHAVTRGRTLLGDVQARESLGADDLIHVVIEGSAPVSQEVRELAHDVEDPAELEKLERAQGGVKFVARFDPSVSTQIMSKLMMDIKPGGLHLFNCSDGKSLEVDQ